MDSAGDNATKKGINLAESQGFNIKVIDTYSGAKDPAEIILENPQNWEDSVLKARSIMDYYYDSAFAKFDKQAPAGKKEIGKIILPAIKRLQNKIEQSYWVQKLSEKLGINESAILEELKSINIENINQQTFANIPSIVTEKNNLTSSGRKKLLEDKIISLIFKDPENLNLVEDCHNDLFCEKNKKFYTRNKKSRIICRFFTKRRI